MKREDVKKGVKVILPPGHYADCPSNPNWGGKHGCVVGIIDDVRNGGGSVGVMWENDCHNGYDCDELSLYDRPEGFCEEIW